MLERSVRRIRSTVVAVLPAVLFLVWDPAGAQGQRRGGDWPNYAADHGSTKYSPLDQIDRHNVERLEVAWQWRSVDYEAKKKGVPGIVSHIFETTPVALDGVLYMSSALGLAAAIDGQSGETLWTWSPFEDGWKIKPKQGFPIARGLESWVSEENKRLLLVSNAHLVSLVAETGRPDPKFGAGGRVDLRSMGEGREPLDVFFWTSPPLVCDDVVVVGNSTLDPYNFKRSVPGYIRGYDVRSGALLWVFNIIPHKGEFGYDTWQEGSAEYSGHGNVWTWMSCDDELGYVYAPTSTPTNDWYGGHRPGDGLFAESLVALEAATGKRVWHFQTVHHGLWDYDLPCAPILVDLTVDGKPVKAVAQVSKQAMTYVFDRTNGKPVWPIEERPVPASDVPGERSSPTQPFPTKPPPYDLQGLTPDDLIDLTPELKAEALKILEKHRYGPLFLPPWLAQAPKRVADGVAADGVASDGVASDGVASDGVATDGVASDGDATGFKRGAVQSPGPVGGSDWNGAAVDPETGILYVPSVTAPMVISLGPPPGRGDVRYMIVGDGFLGGPQGLPITKPPWGRISAIDLNRGEILWVAPNGDGPRDHPALAGLDLPPLGQRGRASPLLTRTLLFLPEGSSDMIAVPPGGGGRMFRAFDKATGAVVWEMELPAGATGAPMTYLAGGRQYIVVPVGERGYHGEFVALALAPQ